ncbi:hypothetical protein [Conexibacter sp. CPCC 206217]|uniref:hypothetical protein n=1 Tax=Conexibacter sp. CPCC 206217 TaxID=3064574 RepID=UPI00272125E0|nr:hypothetical protein [Conexibacter sp. CPCC 206217]MDO8210268.1 hypothetical protein [Conexibacter sp. CPCC 206217]
MEVVDAVEAGGVRVDGVDNDDAAAGGAGGVDDRRECVDQQLGAESSPLEPSVECELGEEDRWDACRAPRPMLLGASSRARRCGAIAK